MFRAIFGVQQVMPGCIKLALSSWNKQLHKGTMNTMKLLFLPSFYGLFGWRGIVDISMTREARKKGMARLDHLALDPSEQGVFFSGSTINNDRYSLTAVTAYFYPLQYFDRVS